MKKVLLLIVLLGCLGACKREPLQWDVDALAPLMRSKLQVQQAIPDSLIFSNDSGVLYFTYSGPLFSLDLDSVLSIPDTTLFDEFRLPIGSITLQPGQTFLTDTVNNRYDIANAKLTLLKIQSGRILLTLSSTLEGPCVLEYSIPSAVKNGSPFFVKETMPPSANGIPVQRTFSYDVSGYDFNLTGDLNNNYNVISTAYRVYIDSNSVPVTIESGDKFNIANTLQGITPEYARGYFGKEHITESGSDTASDFFNQIGGGTLHLSEMDVHLIVDNQVGIDASILVNELVGTNTHNNSSIALQAPITMQPLNINRALENTQNNPPVSASRLIMPLNSSNSNVAEFISNLPNVLNYAIDMTLNPLNDISNTNDFVYLNTGLQATIEAIAPMRFSSSNLVILDTTEFEMESSSQEEVERIQGGFLLVNTTNWYPIDFATQFYLMDANKQVIDSIMPENALVYGAMEGPDNRVIVPKEAQLKVPVTPRQIQHLYEAEYISTRLGFTTTGMTDVTLYESYFVDLRIAGDLTYMITID